MQMPVLYRERVMKEMDKDGEVQKAKPWKTIESPYMLV